MTILFLSSYSSSTANGIIQKKGYISSFIFPFLKIYKKSLLNVANIKYLNISKPVLNAYNEVNSGDIHFIIKLLKLAYIKEQNISKKKWISNQLKKIACFLEFKSNSNYIQTKNFLDKDKTSTNFNKIQKANMAYMHDVIFPRKNSINTRNYIFTIPVTQNKKFIPLNPRLDSSQDDLLKFNNKGLHMSVSYINSLVYPSRNNYFVQNPNQSTLTNYSNNLKQNFLVGKNSFPTKSGIKSQKKSNSENCSFVKNHSILGLLDSPTASEVNSIKEIYSRVKYSYVPTHTGNEIRNIYTKGFQGNVIQNDVNDGANHLGSQLERIRLGRSLTSHQGICLEKNIERHQERQIRLNGPFGYRSVSRQRNLNM